MFQKCSTLQQLNLENFNTHLIENMGSMFENCEKTYFNYIKIQD